MSVWAWIMLLFGVFVLGGGLMICIGVAMRGSSYTDDKEEREIE